MWIAITLAALILGAILVCKKPPSTDPLNRIPLSEQQLLGKWVNVGWTHEINFASEADNKHAVEWSRGLLFGLYERGEKSACCIRLAGRTIRIIGPKQFYWRPDFSPSYQPGQRVQVIPGARGRTPRESIVQAVAYHHKRNQWIYYLVSSNKRQANRWYYNDELRLIDEVPGNARS